MLFLYSNGDIRHQSITVLTFCWCHKWFHYINMLAKRAVKRHFCERITDVMLTGSKSCLFAKRRVLHSVNVPCVIHDGLVLISTRQEHLVAYAVSVKAENSPERCVRFLMCNQGHSLNEWMQTFAWMFFKLKTSLMSAHLWWLFLSSVLTRSELPIGLGSPECWISMDMQDALRIQKAALA